MHDGWTDIFRNLTGVAARKASEKLGRPITSQERAELTTLADYKKMSQVRARVDAIVKDPVTAAALKPWYRQFCKRPCFHDEYLQTYNRPNVTLVDTRGHGVERLTERGVVANGQEYEVDCLIFATGFEVGTSFTRRAGYDIVGMGGKTLSDHWSDGLRTLHGLTSNGFPNCFFLGFTQSAVTVSVPMALDKQARQVTYMIGEARARGHAVLEKKTFDLPVTFPNGEDRVYATENVGEIVIPRKDALVSGANFEVLIGFEVTPTMAAPAPLLETLKPGELWRWSKE